MNGLLTVEEAAKILDYHPNHVRRMLRQGKIRGKKPSGYAWMISRREVRRIKAAQDRHGRYRADSLWW